VVSHVLLLLSKWRIAPAGARGAQRFDSDAVTAMPLTAKYLKKMIARPDRYADRH